MRLPIVTALLVGASLVAVGAHADDVPPEPLPGEPVPAPPRLRPVAPEPPEEEESAPEPMSEGRMLVSAYNSGFQWGLSPGVILSGGRASFAIGAELGYGFDTGPVILVPGVRLGAYFIDPNVYLGMPTLKLVLPIDRFAPFVIGGAGAGHVEGDARHAAATGAALMGGGGFMIHFEHIAFGAEATYQTITGTGFAGLGVGPILALMF